ncbi:MAG TPA: PQQ-binding-like beta-propeller repeat protein [Planctomycetota bacterium]|nr:PQQ-binding-like beta-propeller repeat protein [Planctomycetota bacterium]HRR79416.1 PQQ-binding-like beta-propeller repeat protein [Planctomycetota bacterium]HRT93491.1 PQQ-binding-like beta-propeller repeat protein [Planctomycetota bacterium]
MAKEVLQAAMLKTGLAFHIGCGRAESPGLTAALAEQGLVVHGLALDEAAAARARKAIEAKNLAGRAMVECVAPKPLPYLNDLANLVVVEDLAALAAAGVTRDELLRVLAPGGKLCILEAGKWAATMKPRPQEMDDWSHPQHGPDGNMVSADKAFRFPIGFRWIDGVPMNLVRWAGVRGWVVANGRCFTLSSTQLENVGLREKPHYLVARDAWNGLPLWKINCETTDDGSYLTWTNAGPLAADDARVYAVKRDKAIAVHAATGEIAYTCPNRFPPCRLLVAEGLLVCSCWQERDFSQAPWHSFDKPKEKDPNDPTKEIAKPPRPSLWSTWIAKSGAGALEAYDAATGAARWSLPFAADTMVAADGVLYGIVQIGNPPSEHQLVAIGLKDGKERWRTSSAKLGPEADFQLNVAGPGYVIVARRKANAILAFSAKDGTLLWQTPSGAHWTPVVDGLVWVGNRKLDPLTGETRGNLAHGVGGQGCTPSAIVNDVLTQSRGCSYVQLPPDNDPARGRAEGLRYDGARGGCMEGMVPANGMFYTAQNNCGCAPGHVYGFLAMGPSGAWPKADDFAKARPVEKGPAFGAVEETSVGVADWPLFLGNAARSSASAAQLPESLKEAWRTQVASPGDGLLGTTWRSRLESPLSAPTAAYGMVFVAKTDAGQVVALDAATGKPAWRFWAGGRIDTPPTLHRGLALFGCHDGYVYALRAQDGALAWRTRVAPWERRMVVHGQIESVWPAVGTVLVHDGVLFANAGRTSESDGGIALVALDPATGNPLWGGAVAPGPLRQNDLLRVSDGKLLWQHVPIDPRTGAADLKAPVPKGASQGGLMDGTWTVLGKRRAGNAFATGNVRADLLAWNDALVATPQAAIPQEAQKPASELEEKPAPAKGWNAALPANAQVEALGLAANAAIYAGRLRSGAEGRAAGFLLVLSAADGRKRAEFALAAPPTFEGIAVAGDRLFVALQDGSLVCFGKP